MNKYAKRAILAAIVLAACTEIPTDSPISEITSDSLAPLYMAAPGGAVEGEYVVVLRPEAVLSTSAAAVSASVSADVIAQFNGPIRGFGARLDPGQLATLRQNPAVAWVEENQIMRADVNVQMMDANGDPWGLDRIDQVTNALDQMYHYNRRAPGVTAYVFDTGIKLNHNDFQTGGQSRAQNVFDAFGGNGYDCNGHGTHVAGTIGGRKYGVAKLVQLRGLRVLDCNGQGSSIGLINAITWVLTNAQLPAVANMSLSFQAVVPSVNIFVDAMEALGVFVAVSAGNDDNPQSGGALNVGYSCGISPASALGAFTVAASDKQDNKASFSNWGRCVDIYAPGVAIQSAWWPSGTAILNGTSMAAPHVAGTAALLLHKKPTWLPPAIRRQIFNRAIANAIANNDAQFWQYGTPNLLLYKETL